MGYVVSVLDAEMVSDQEGACVGEYVRRQVVCIIDQDIVPT